MLKIDRVTRVLRYGIGTITMKKPSSTNTMLLAAAFFLLVCLASSGCMRMIMTPEARQVVTQTGVATQSCKPRGVVFALAPFSSPEQPLDQLKIRADQIGADTLVLLGPAGTRTRDWSARAYRCRNVRSATPMQLPSPPLPANPSTGGA